MNTEIEYLYRDAENNKVWNKCIVEGTFTDKQIKTILDCCDVDGRFIPDMVGLPSEKFGDYDDEIDGPWFELFLDSFEVQTYKRPTSCLDVQSVVAAFVRAKGHWHLANYIATAESLGWNVLFIDESTIEFCRVLSAGKIDSFAVEIETMSEEVNSYAKSIKDKDLAQKLFELGEALEREVLV